MLECLEFHLVVSCSGCRIALPVNGVTPTVRCYHCGETTALAPEFWTRLIDGERVARALALPAGEPGRVRLPFVHGADLRFGSGAPRCQRCAGPALEPGALLEAAAAGQTRCACPGCGAAIQLRAPDELVRAIVPRARLVVHESAPDDDARALPARATPVVFACAKCAGALAVDGTTRTVTCTYCSTPSYLPDGVWQQLHPVPKPHAWFVIVGWESPADRRRARWSNQDAREADAGSAGLTPEEYGALARDDASPVLHALARNPAAPPAALHHLATSADHDARMLVAANPTTAPATLALLAGDASDELVQIVAADPRLPAEAVEQLAATGSARVRVIAIQHPALALATLHTLARDDSERIQDAARARLEQLRAQGVDVDAGRGFFAKLFG